METQPFALSFVNKNLIASCFVGISLGALTMFSPWLGLAGAAAGIFIVAALNKPVILCYAVILATIFMSGMTRGRLIPFLIPDEVVLVFVTALSIPVILLKKRKPATSGASLPTIGLILLSVGTSIIPSFVFLIRGIELSVSEYFSLIAPLQYILVYIIFRYLPRDEKETRAVLRLALICAAIVGIVGLLQTMRVGFVLNILSSLYRSSHEEAALAAGRVSSLLGAWNSLGTFLMLNLIVLRALSVIKPGVMNPLLFVAVTVFCAGCLIASGSYAGLGGLIAGLVLFEIFDGRGKKAMLALLVSLVVLAIPLQENIIARITYQYRYGGLIPQTLAFRFYVWNDVFIPLIKKTWLWGFRPTIPTTFIWQYPESQYFELLLRSGIFSLLAHLAWVGLALIWLYRNFRAQSDLRSALSISLFIIFVILSIMGLTNGVFSYSGVIEYVWILLGLIGALGEFK